MSEIRFLPCGDQALTVEFGNAIDAGINTRVCALARFLAEERVPGIRETVPTFRSLLITYHPAILPYKKLIRTLEPLIARASGTSAGKRRVIELPVCYGGQYGEDISDVAAHAGISIDEVVRRHSGTEYLIYMLGFLPGFAYLGGLDPTIVTPRLASPRTRIPAGSVGIGGEQTGVYPLDSPGGWRLIGMTPVKPYDPSRKEPILYQAGDYIRFVPIDEKTFLDIHAQVEADIYQVHIREGGAV
ncbi:MAG: 5-oxoprolinase subunit PxpB [Clostridiaceae bacterium]|nr:5-oxoprolinase subunit PxpB [Clostridiaceae bacterium]